MSERIPVLLDTDIGSDIDDAVCLSYLLRQPRCELVGVTTATGNVVQRAALAAEICRAAGRDDVPIHAGAPGPLLFGPGQPNVPQYEAVASRPHRTDFPPGAALEFMRQTIRQRPGEIVLLAIGPMTNLGLLFAADPEIPSLLKELVLMCGVFTAGNGHGPGAREWNAFCDPVATAITYRARPPRFTSIGLEVTTRCILGADECRARFQKAGGPLSIVAEMAEVWFRGSPRITFHDPLAASVIFEEGLCRYQEGLVEVETTSQRLGGLTTWNPNSEEKPHRIAVSVDSEAFFAHYFGVVGG
ncbi:MAG TPA: nucleoside hydrolase [Armatimonadota bacterium]|nr:nucleoside hydrolase [Armatimonadota bacterium]HOJ20657.1 nucleoside hydrolase [Armatimonadota bacterium]HOM80187.1 nucleoside hydrolase [Armatimonadota bacterium]HOQ27812.1 nucleoside hydrolase [Armatimonadota bacterium]HPO71610.1 nucleoside hydrolase [Armatimonadota bacterium]